MQQQKAADSLQQSDNQINTNDLYIPPSQQQHQLHILIMQCQSALSRQIIEQFRNDHEIQMNPHCIIGVTYQAATSTHKDMIADGAIERLIQISDKQSYYKELLKSDIIVVQLKEKDYVFIEHTFKVLQQLKLNNKKKVICISQMRSWNTLKNNNLQMNQQILNGRHGTDFYLQQLQNKCLSLYMKNNMIESYILCAGMVYGNGENQLFGMFKRALQQREILKVYGEGSNVVPMIHCKDLATMVRIVGDKVEWSANKNYYLVVDDAHLTQKEIVEGIAKEIGNGKIQHINIQQGYLESDFQRMSIDLKVKRNFIDINWYCRQGFISNLSTIITQFNNYRGLRANKILIAGAPVSGKSDLAKQLSAMYGLPIIQMKELIEMVKNSQDEQSIILQKKLEQLRIVKVEQERKLHEEMKKKKKGKGVEQFDGDKVVVRLVDEDLSQVVKWRLGMSECSNKGYILDGVLKSYRQCEMVFMKKRDKQRQNQQKQQNEQQQQLNNDMLPNSIFIFDATQEQIRDKIKTLPVEAVSSNPHCSEEHLKRRYQNYQKINEQKTLKSFFDGKVDIMNAPINYHSMDQFADFIERNGPLGFKKTLTEEQLQNKVQQQEKKTIQNNIQLVSQEQKSQGSQVQKQNEQISEEFDIEKLTSSEQQILNEKSRPIRQYLIDNVIPHITEGLLQICQDTPMDPIKYLIEFLEAKKKKKKNVRIIEIDKNNEIDKIEKQQQN